MRFRLAVGVLAGLLMALTAAVALGWWPVSVDHEIAGMLPGSQAGGTASLVLALAAGVTTLGHTAGHRGPDGAARRRVLLAGAVLSARQGGPEAPWRP